MKTLREASAELGIPEKEIKTMVDLRKIRAVMKKGQMLFAPDELAKIRQRRRTLTESEIKSSAAEAAATPKPAMTPSPAIKRPPAPKRPPMG